MSTFVPQIEAFFDEATFTISYVVSDPKTSHCAIIDSVLDYDSSSGRTNTASADKIIHHIKEKGLSVSWILETHVHADHLSAGPYLRETLGGKLAIGSEITKVQNEFGNLFNAGDDFSRDGRQFDHLFKDQEAFQIGNIEAKVLHTPGHTPACVTYLIGDVGFVGDTLFMPDFGTARVDFPGGSAETLYQSIQTLFALPDETRLFMCHDYKAPGRDHFAWQTTVAEERQKNVHVNDQVSKQEFITRRLARDEELGMPKLLLPSIQVNMRAGEFPEPEENGVSYLKIPINGV